MITRHFIRNKTTTIPNNEIWYTSSDGQIVTPNAYDFGANLVENNYTDGQGMMVFDGI